jgi:hypothetical protein
MNVVFSISVDGKVISKLADEKHEVIRFHKGPYSLEKWCRPSCSKLNFQKLFPSSTISLEVPFTLDEVKAAIWDCDDNKASQFDVVNFFFIKKA